MFSTPEAWLKLNMDAALGPSKGCTAVVLRDRVGGVLKGWASFFPVCSLLLIEELDFRLAICLEEKIY